MFHRSKTTRSVDGDAFKEATIIIKISTQHLQQGNSAEDKFSNEDQLFYKEHEKKLRWNLTWHKERGERPWGEKWFPGYFVLYGKKKGGKKGRYYAGIPKTTNSQCQTAHTKSFPLRIASISPTSSIWPSDYITNPLLDAGPPACMCTTALCCGFTCIPYDRRKAI